MISKLKPYLFRGGVLLGGSAMASKFLGFLRDRLLVESFDPAQVDLVFIAFRIPDFFFFLFVGATLSVILIPQLANLKKSEVTEYVSSFFWLIFIFFGVLCTAGFFGAHYLVDLIAPNLDISLKSQVAHISQYLFLSVFLLSLSGIFGAYLQAKQKFISLAMAPLFYMGSIVLGIYLFSDQFGLSIIGYSAVIGALIHLFANISHFFYSEGIIQFHWKKPIEAWANFQGDFWRRVFNNSAFQINQTIDIWITSFLITGAVTAFSIGTSLGHVLLSIIGMSVANSAFPKLTKVKYNWGKQEVILNNSIKWILLWTVPFAIIGALISTQLLSILFVLDGPVLEMGSTVFFWTVISLPFACMIPIFSRVFLANDDSKTPLYINVFSLTIATVLAAVLALRVLPPDKAILGLAYGNFTANVLGAILFYYFLKTKKWKTRSK